MNNNTHILTALINSERMLELIHFIKQWICLFMDSTCLVSFLCHKVKMCYVRLFLLCYVRLFLLCYVRLFLLL